VILVAEPGSCNGWLAMCEQHREECFYWAGWSSDNTMFEICKCQLLNHIDSRSCVIEDSLLLSEELLNSSHTSHAGIPDTRSGWHWTCFGHKKGVV